MLTEVFYTFVITSAVGLVIGIARMCYKSKCKNFKLCCLQIERDVETENNADLVLDLARRLSTTSESGIKIKEVEDNVLHYENVYHKTIPKKLNQFVKDVPSKDTPSKEVSISALEAGELTNVSLGGS